MAAATSSVRTPRPPINAEETLAWLESRISSIYSASSARAEDDTSPLLTHKEYLDAYTSIHDYCALTKRTSKDGKISQANRGAHLLGEDLYHTLEKHVRVHCREEKSKILGTHLGTDDNSQNSETLIAQYLQQWSKFSHVAGFMARLFRFLDRHWVKREQDEKRGKGPYDVHDLHLSVWKEEVLQIKELPIDLQFGSSYTAPASSKITSAAAKMTQEQPSGHQVLLPRFTQSLTTINAIYREPAAEEQENENNEQDKPNKAGGS